MRREFGRAGPRDQRVLLHQWLRRLAKSRRPAVGAKGQTGRLARDGARLGAGAEGPGNAMGHGRNMAAERGLG